MAKNVGEKDAYTMDWPDLAPWYLTLRVTAICIGLDTLVFLLSFNVPHPQPFLSGAVGVLSFMVWADLRGL
jgi:hypothetical protein